MPYVAGVYPLEGAVPSGNVLVSTDDTNLRSTVISRWPDGSARIMVVASDRAVTSGSAQSINVKAGAPSGTDLTSARIGALMTNVTVNVPGIASASITDFSAPHKIWWTNPRTICCRYRLAIGTDMEALVDIQAFASPQNRAFVEVVVENSKMNSASPIRPSAKNYTGATVAVNGSTIITVNSSQGHHGSHEAFRAWYASTWVGGDPGLEITHDTASMQAHRMFFKVIRSAGAKSTYQNDTYQPFRTGRWPGSGMGSGGDSAQIGGLALWDADYLQTGDKFARRGVLAAALSCLSYSINYRDSVTGLPPTADQTNGKRITGPANWPGDFFNFTDTVEPCWELAHCGSVGYMAFMCRPSPVFIELAQKAAVYNGVVFSTTWVVQELNQIRSIGWNARNLVQAIFLTPDGDTWKTAGIDALYRNVQYWTSQNNGTKGNLLGFCFKDQTYEPTGSPDFEAGEDGMQRPTMEDEYFLTEAVKIAFSKPFPLSQPSRQTEMDAFVDKACEFPIRFVNEAVNGEWRAIGASRLTVSSSETSYVQNNWGAVQAWQFNQDQPMPSPGPWRPGRGVHSYSQLETASSAGAYYESYFWAAFVAAVERDIPGAATAWSRVTSPTTGISNLSSWADGFATDPRWGAYPRNKS
jgi:hypothetical protein